MRFAGWRVTIRAPTHGNTSARTAFNAEGDDSRPLMLGYVRAAKPRAGAASPIDAPTESQAMRLAGRKLTLALDTTRALALGDRSGWAPWLHRCASRRRSRAGKPQARGVVVLTFAWWKPERGIGGPPGSRRRSPLVRLAPSQKGEPAGCQAWPRPSPYREQWKRLRTPTARQDCRSLLASVESSLSSYLTGPSSHLDWVLHPRLARLTWRATTPSTPVCCRPFRRCARRQPSSSWSFWQACRSGSTARRASALWRRE